MMKALAPALVWFLLLVPGRAWCQDNAAGRHARLVEHLKKTAAEISSRSLLDIRTLEDWKEKRPSVRRELLYMLGLDPLPERTPLEAEVKGTLERAEYRVEKVVYQSLPGLYVTGNFYLPKKHAGIRSGRIGRRTSRASSNNSSNYSRGTTTSGCSATAVTNEPS